MLNSNDVQLFCDLLDRLGNSLRELVVKYELLLSSKTRETSDRERTDMAVASMVKEVESMAGDIEALRELISENRDGYIQSAAHIQAIISSVGVMHDKLEATKSEIVTAKTLASEGKSVMLHVDQHMDGFGAQLAAIQSIPSEIAKMVAAVEEMKRQFEPFKKLAVLMSKPVAIAVAIYVIIATIFAVMEGIDQFDKAKDKLLPSHSYFVTNSVSAKP